VNDPDYGSQGGQQARNAIQRVVKVARQGQARLNAYRRETAALGIWLRSHLFRQGRKGRLTKVGHSLRSAVISRRLRQRQETHRNGGGPSSPAIVCTLQRVEQATRRKKP
jgi:hypothetical protein